MGFKLLNVDQNVFTGNASEYTSENFLEYSLIFVVWNQTWLAGQGNGVTQQHVWVLWLQI